MGTGAGETHNSAQNMLTPCSSPCGDNVPFVVLPSLSSSTYTACSWSRTLNQAFSLPLPPFSPPTKKLYKQPVKERETCSHPEPPHGTHACAFLGRKGGGRHRPLPQCVCSSAHQTLPRVPSVGKRCPLSDTGPCTFSLWPSGGKNLCPFGRDVQHP